MNKKTITLLEKAGYKVYGSLISVNGELFPVPLVKGNSKIGTAIWHASTLPGNGLFAIEYHGEAINEHGTCPLTCDGCYGLHGCYTYTNTKYRIAKRTIFLRKYPADYFRVCRMMIEGENIKLVRLHATGDFIRGEASGWYRIFKDMPQLKGWTYTKCLIAGDVARLDSLNNFNIVKSVIPGIGFNYGHIDYVLSAYEKLTAAGENVYICRCGIDKKQHCSNCTGCALNKYVLFIEHGTGYKAVNDPLYETIKTLIESQPKYIA